MVLLENEFQKINRKDINDIVNNSSIEVEEMDSLPMYILDTGFKEYDSIYGGLWQKELMMIAAPAGNEKNIYVLNIMHNILKRNERAWVIYFSPEMDRKQFLTYSLSIESGCNHETISMGSLDGLSYALLRSDALRMVTWPLILDDNIDFSIKGIAKRCLKYQKKLQKIGSGVPRVIIIDNLQLIDKNENSDDVKKTDCSVKCQKLKELAERLDATIIILYSLNESSMIRDNNRLRKKEIDQSRIIV